MNSKYNYIWYLKDTNFIKDKGTVFSCFSCGGGSTMGYKLAGFDVIGCNEIDVKMFEMYTTNHNPKFKYNIPIQELKNIENLPDELYNLDILDGSPPCSSFSTAGNREKDWGKLKVFREGQAKQILDTLFFDFIDLGKKLQPKIIVAENVEGLLFGNAKKYVKNIYDAFYSAGYVPQHILLNSNVMGVPQSRKRVFFIAVRQDLLSNLTLYYKDVFNKIPKLNLSFNYNKISLNSFVQGTEKRISQNYSVNRFGDSLLDITKPAPTLTSNGRFWLDEQNLVNDESLKKISTFPLDYNFLNNKVMYVCGMSVPPVMMANLSEQLYVQILSKINS